MGGWIAALCVIAHLERVERLVDAAGFTPPMDFDAKQLAGLNPSTREGMQELAARVFYNKQLYASDAAIDLGLELRLSAGDGYTIQSLIESIARREDVLDGRLSTIKQPPLAEYGERFKR